LCYLWHSKTLMTEYAPQSPEYERSQNVLAALHNALQTACVDPADPAESLAAQRDRFTAVIAAAHELPFDAHAHTLIDHYATVVDFTWFGGHGDSLPAALGYFPIDSTAEGKWGEIRLKAEVMNHATFDSITQTLMPLGLGNLLIERMRFAGQNQPKIDAAFKAAVDSTPAVKWFEAFNVGTPKAELPLTPIERAGPEAAIRQAALSRMGPAPHMPSRPHPGAQGYIDRQNRLLDDVTTLKPRPHQHDTALRAVKRYVDNGVAPYRYDIPVARQEYDTEDGTLSEYAADNQHLATHDMVEVACATADITDLPPAITAQLDEISREFYIEVFHNACTGVQSYEVLYDAAYNSCREYFLDHLMSGFNLVNGQLVTDMLSTVKQLAPDQPIDYEQYTAASNQTFPHERIRRFSHVTKHEIEKGRRFLIGTLEKRHEPVPGARRLLQQARVTANVPMHPPGASKADLILALKDFRGDPHVPGYRLIAANRLTQRYYFSYLPDDDPYKPNKTPVPTAISADLSAQYTAAQLTLLARDIGRTTSLTLSRLAELAKQRSVYTPRPNSRPDFTSLLVDLPAFAAFAVRRKLRGTCDIYTLFGKRSTDRVLPPTQSFATAGYVIPSGGTSISGVRHSQLAITDTGGRITSIIDWTPTGRGSASYAPIKKRGAKVTHHIATPVPSRHRKLGPPLTIRGQVAVSTTQLLMQLGVVFAPGIAEPIPSDYIFSRTRALGSRHPIAATLGALLRAGDAAETHETLPPQHMAELLGAMAVIAQVRQRDRIGTSHAQLDMLEAVLLPIVHFSERNKIYADERS
jgi:hypothetical protein